MFYLPRRFCSFTVVPLDSATDGTVIIFIYLSTMNTNPASLKSLEKYVFTESICNISFWQDFELIKQINNNIVDLKGRYF